MGATAAGTPDLNQTNRVRERDRERKCGDRDFAFLYTMTTSI